jgi:hypothetical protein
MSARTGGLASRLMATVEFGGSLMPISYAASGRLSPTDALFGGSSLHDRRFDGRRQAPAKLGASALDALGPEGVFLGQEQERLQTLDVSDAGLQAKPGGAGAIG